MNTVLDPLAARYVPWLARPVEHATEHTAIAAGDEAPEQVRAMPIVLRIEKAEPPERTPLLEAAAAAAVAVCLDSRAEPGGPWHDPVARWVSGRIRKLARRARGSHWHAVKDLPGVTVDVRGAQARALLPGPVDAVAPEVARLQISGSELPADEPEPPPADRPVLWLNPQVPMTAGKAAAQVGHGSMFLAALLDPESLAAWGEQEYRCSVRTASPGRWQDLVPGPDLERAWRRQGIAAVRDAGYTEVAPGTTTVLAQLHP